MKASPQATLKGEDLWRSGGTSVVFLNSGAGDGILVRFRDNHWIVIDANQVGGHVPAIEFLKHFAGDEDQTFDLVHLSHLHRDHYSGLASLLAYLRQRGKPPAHVRLPFSLDLLSHIAESSASYSDHDHGPLPTLVTELNTLQKAGAEILPIQQGPFQDHCLFLLPSLRQTAAPSLIAQAYQVVLDGATDYVTSISKDLRRWEQQSSSVTIIRCHDKLVLLGGDAPTSSWASLYPIPVNQPFWQGFYGGSTLSVVDMDGDGQYHFKPSCVLKVPHHGADRERIPAELLLRILIGRGTFQRYPISVFLCDGKRHPGLSSLEEHLATSETLLLSSLPDPTVLRRLRQNTQDALVEAMSLLPGSDALEKAIGSESFTAYPFVIGRKPDFTPWKDSESWSFAVLSFDERGSHVNLRNFIMADCASRAFRWVDDSSLRVDW